MGRAVTVARKETWGDVGRLYHTTMRDKRFTTAHAREAGYYLRRGEGMTVGSKTFKASYTGRKLSMFGHTRPLEFTGETRALVRRATIKTFALKCQVRYEGARKFNFRNPKSRINMAEEFRRILPHEERELAAEFNAKFDQRFDTLKKYYEE